MARIMKSVQSLSFGLCAIAFLTSCSSALPPAPSVAEPTNAAQPSFGKIVSIRPVTFPAGQTAGIAGFNAVLTALGQETAAPPVTGEEIVIQKDDGNPASLAQQSPPANLQIGDRVAVIQGAAVRILKQN